MNNTYRLFSVPAIMSIVWLLLLSVGIPAWGPAQQTPVPINVGGVQITGIPTDWTSHHVVFSNPGTQENAIERGKYDEWLRIVNDPRYIFQQLRRGLPAQGPAAQDAAIVQQQAAESQAAADGQGSEAAAQATQKPRRQKITKDWSMVLGSGAPGVGAGMYPAKFSFNPIGNPNCGNTSSPDFVVYNAGAAGSSTQASVVAYDNLYSSCSGQVPAVYWAFNTGGTVSTSIAFSSTGSQLAFVQTPGSGNAQLVLLKWAATPTGRNVTSGNTNVSSGSKNFTVSSSTPLTSMDVGAGISGTGIPAGDTIATVTSATAGTLTAAATGNGTSGETLSITADAGGPHGPTAVTNSNYPGCTAPCMTTITFSGTSRSDMISSPFYDYAHDTLYVGDASGGLHKFTPVFNGTPAEVGSPWASPSTTALSSPVYDSASGNVFVGDASGYLYSVNSSASVTKSFQVAVSPGIVDGPLVDSSAEQVYAFVPEDMNANNSSLSPCGCSSGSPCPKLLACNGVIQLPANFTSTTDYAESAMGIYTTNAIYTGALDNLYWTNGTGNLYVSGSAAGSTSSPYTPHEPKLERIPVTTSGLSSNPCQSGTGTLTNCSSLQCGINIAIMTNGAATGSPVTEILNGSADYIFTSVSGNSNLSTTGCGTGNACVYSWNTTSAISSGTAPAAGLLVAGGTSGIIIDNTSSTSGASNIYFSTLGASGTCSSSGTVTSGSCAVQAAQSGL